ncbi:hypothetical protein GGI15_003640 [Coemansia interrupta]|uniref:Homeobox domain-containing protein n=1 Tax=Coemansia interrupta TaxID=1126814 RepID=A0A9W8H8K3_9FUNG|nr:hypothetical protein GGI15_003640 [Coemansia interrupta]
MPPPQPPQTDLKPNFYNPYHVKHRRRTTKEQLELLEGTFKNTPKPSSDIRKALAQKLGMTAREVQIWFQNRRAKQKNLMMRASSTGAADGEKTSMEPETSPLSPTDDCVSQASLISSLLPASAGLPVAAANKHVRASSADHAQVPLACPALVSPPASSHSSSFASAISVANAAAAAAASSSTPSTSKEMPTHVLRRHSDVPVSFLHSETATRAAAAAIASASVSATVGATAMRPTTASSTMGSAAGITAHTEYSPPPALIPGYPQPVQMGTVSQEMLARNYAMAPPSSSSSSASRPMQLVPTAQQMQQQKKRKNNGNPANNSNRTARVHQEAFDGTNKLPLKPDDMSPRSADEQFTLLDPSNLPNFAMPGTSLVMPSSNGLSMPFLPYGNPGMRWPPPASYNLQPQLGDGGHPSAGFAQSMLPTDVLNLFSGLLAMNNGSSVPAAAGNGPYPDLTLNTFGLTELGTGPSTAASHGMGSADIQFGMDPTMAFLHSLTMPGQQSHSAKPAGVALNPSEQPTAMALAQTQTLASGSSPGTATTALPQRVSASRDCGKSSGGNASESPSGAAMSPIPGSAFSPYDSQGQAAKQQHGAMFMPSAATAFSHLVATSGMNDAGVLGAAATTELFASNSSNSPSQQHII